MEFSKWERAIYYAKYNGKEDVAEKIMQRLWADSKRPKQNLMNLFKGITTPKQKTVDVFVEETGLTYEFFKDEK